MSSEDAPFLDCAWSLPTKIPELHNVCACACTHACACAFVFKEVKTSLQKSVSETERMHVFNTVVSQLR